jgi:exosortase K
LSIQKNIRYYIAALSIFIGIKLYCSNAGSDGLLFLLKPTDKIVGLLTGERSVYLAGEGFYFNRLNILIEGSCSGFNFWILCFLMLVFLSLRFLTRSLHKTAAIPVFLFLSYIFTIVVNASRIFVSIIVQRQANNFMPARPHLILHDVTGIVINLVFLVVIYHIIEKYLTAKQQHAKLTST